eukprot:COSAG02_NODE_666_length_18722_cov_237.372765_13_plen_78_part_00
MRKHELQELVRTSAASDDRRETTGISLEPEADAVWNETAPEDRAKIVTTGFRQSAVGYYTSTMCEHGGRWVGAVFER